MVLQLNNHGGVRRPVRRRNRPKALSGTSTLKGRNSEAATALVLSRNRPKALSGTSTLTSRVWPGLPLLGRNRPKALSGTSTKFSLDSVLLRLLR